MRKTLTALAAAGLIAATALMAPIDAQARPRGVGAAIFGGLVGAAVVGALLAPRYYYGQEPVYAPAQGYVVYAGYRRPVPAPGCWWGRAPLYDGYGNVVGYGRPVLFCP